jgi:hypothetical protein
MLLLIQPGGVQSLRDSLSASQQRIRSPDDFDFAFVYIYMLSTGSAASTFFMLLNRPGLDGRSSHNPPRYTQYLTAQNIYAYILATLPTFSLLAPLLPFVQKSLTRRPVRTYADWKTGFLNLCIPPAYMSADSVYCLDNFLLIKFPPGAPRRSCIRRVSPARPRLAVRFNHIPIWRRKSLEFDNRGRRTGPLDLWLGRSFTHPEKVRERKRYLSTVGGFVEGTKDLLLSSPFERRLWRTASAKGTITWNGLWGRMTEMAHDLRKTFCTFLGRGPGEGKLLSKLAVYYLK